MGAAYLLPCAALAVLLAALVSFPAAWSARYAMLPVDPASGWLLKETLGWALVSLPSARYRLLGIPRPSPAAEGFHDAFDLPALGSAPPRSSDFFAENFYFWGNSADGEFIYTLRLAFHGAQGRRVWPWFHVARKGQKWELPKEILSNTMAHSEGDGVEAVAPGLGHLRFICVVPLKQWRLTYEGILVRADDGVRAEAKASFLVTLAEDNVFQYHLHMDAWALGRSLAAVPWSLGFLANLKSQRQERISSQGTVLANMTWAGLPTPPPPVVNLPMDGSRDHNWGIRNWRYMWRYIYIPPVRMYPSLRVANVSYDSFIGSFVEYGSTMRDVAIGGLVGGDGAILAWAGATSMRKIAPEWFEAMSSNGVGIGDRTLSRGIFEWDVGLSAGEYVLHVEVERGTSVGLWQHSFFTPEGDFEIHEALTRWTFTVRRLHDKVIICSAKGLGMMEFGANLIGSDERA